MRIIETYFEYGITVLTYYEYLIEDYKYSNICTLTFNRPMWYDLQFDATLERKDIKDPAKTQTCYLLR
jgi:hypothetical protein